MGIVGPEVAWLIELDGAIKDVIMVGSSSMNSMETEFTSKH